MSFQPGAFQPVAEAKFLTLFSESDNRHQVEYFFVVVSHPPGNLFQFSIAPRIYELESMS